MLNDSFQPKCDLELHIAKTGHIPILDVRKLYDVINQMLIPQGSIEFRERRMSISQLSEKTSGVEGSVDALDKSIRGADNQPSVAAHLRPSARGSCLLLLFIAFFR